MAKSRFLALRTASATASTPAFRKGRQVQMTDEQAQPFIEAGALKPLGLAPTQKSGSAAPGETTPTKVQEDLGTSIVDDDILPAQSKVESSEDSGEAAAEPATTDSADVDADPVTETQSDETQDAQTQSAEPQAVETDSVQDAETDATDSEPTQSETTDEEAATVTYEVDIDDADGSYADWFNQLLASKDVDARFDSSTGRPRIDLPADADTETLTAWVDAFHAAYPDFASVTASKVE